MMKASHPPHVEGEVARPGSRRSTLGLLTALAVGVVSLLVLSNSIAQESVSFTREVLPILRANCVGCHKPGKSKGGLDLTTHAALMKGDKNGPVILPQDAATSPLLESISGTEPEMPKEGEPLNEQEVALLASSADAAKKRELGSAGGAE